MRVHLLPLGRGRFDLYAEPVETANEPPAHDAGWMRHALHRSGEQWRRLVDTARLDQATSRLGKWRDTVICSLANSIEEQRTMWTLRSTAEADTYFPANMPAATAREQLMSILANARRFHGIRFAVYLVLFVASGILFFVPGPNIVAYYLGFQAFGHLQSWLGARRGSATVSWTLLPNDDLAELAALAEQSRASRSARIGAIAERLGLPRLPAFFERAAG